MIDKTSKIYVAGHTGLVGSAIERELSREGFSNVIVQTSSKLDLRNREDTLEFFEREKPEYVFLAAARVGGIKANLDFPATFLYDNLQIQMNVIDSARISNVKKLLNVSCCCAYPTACDQPIREEYLLTGVPEPTNEAFAIAKIAGIEMCQAYNKQYQTNFISAIPSNLYGFNDDFDPKFGHLVGQTMSLIHNAQKEGKDYITLGGTGRPIRDFVYSEDLANACLFLMNHDNPPEITNVGTGEGYTKKEVAERIKNIMGFKGTIIFDTSRPDGMLERVVSPEKLNSLGWKAKTSFEKGLRETYSWFLKNKA